MNSQAQIDSDLYRFDGRYYEIDQTPDVLVLRLRNSVLGQRRFLTFVLFIAAVCALDPWLLKWFAFQKLMPVGTLVQLINFSICLATIIGLWPLLGGETWTFHANGEVQLKRGWFKPLKWTHVRTLQAWKLGKTFFLRFEVEGQKPVGIGSLGLGRSEPSWRNDAHQIASFLGVPLHIPPV
jgi:hypothetical protein